MTTLKTLRDGGIHRLFFFERKTGTLFIFPARDLVANFDIANFKFLICTKGNTFQTNTGFY